MLELSGIFTLRSWRSLFMGYLDNWSMLDLIKTNKLLNKHKKYVYMMIFQTITMLNFTHSNFPLTCESSYKLLYDKSYTYKYLIYKHIWFGQTKIVYTFDNIKILVKNNSILRKMVKSYIDNQIIGTDTYRMIQNVLLSD